MSAAKPDPSVPKVRANVAILTFRQAQDEVKEDRVVSQMAIQS